MTAPVEIDIGDARRSSNKHMDAVALWITKALTNPEPQSEPNEPLTLTLWTLAAFASTAYVLSLVTKSNSWPDRFWSLAPPVYAAIFAWSNPTPRLVALAVLIGLWGTRLTYNFARKGGYSLSGDDYRWAYVKNLWFGSHEWLWQVFNLFFIAFYNCFIGIFVSHIERF
jgi:steroid 5-alpha reductase family enzyme